MDSNSPVVSTRALTVVYIPQSQPPEVVSGPGGVTRGTQILNLGPVREVIKSVYRKIVTLTCRDQIRIDINHENTMSTTFPYNAILFGPKKGRTIKPLEGRKITFQWNIKDRKKRPVPYTHKHFIDIAFATFFNCLPAVCAPRNFYYSVRIVPFSSRNQNAHHHLHLA
ncbi:hypothetical protein GWI33_002983 [Rhynchophorus ferrugineus]|uniref:Uncharacterized protein n=1 Tax=Rhynchophorus ferrugineus TaxID=354439 RepID=A0A834INJ6_RHYFE|nr:hypothetical protein GWI33_002983 [Rhynchophorus ferrugineus]